MLIKSHSARILFVDGQRPDLEPVYPVLEQPPSHAPSPRLGREKEHFQPSLFRPHKSHPASVPIPDCRKIGHRGQGLGDVSSEPFNLLL